MMRTPASTIVVLLATAALSSCSATRASHNTGTGTGTGPLPADTASAGTGSAGSPVAAGTLSIKDFAFTPAALTIKAGSTVTVTNHDSATHTWTATNKAFDSGDLATGKTFTFTFTFTKPGTYSYLCSIHPSMHGTVTVTP